jgi:hypothetical protein
VGNDAGGKNSNKPASIVLVLHHALVISSLKCLIQSSETKQPYVVGGVIEAPRMLSFSLSVQLFTRASIPGSPARHFSFKRLTFRIKLAEPGTTIFFFHRHS